MTDNEKYVEFVQENRGDLQALGILLCRLLQADLHTMTVKPSAVFVAVMAMNRRGFATTKPVEQLISELDATGRELLTDGFGGSILRL